MRNKCRITAVPALECISPTIEPITAFLLLRPVAAMAAPLQDRKDVQGKIHLLTACKVRQEKKEKCSDDRGGKHVA